MTGIGLNCCWSTRCLCRSASVFRLFLVLIAVLTLTPQAKAFSLLTHEQIVDIAWKDEIEPVLLARFPNATAEDLKKAHAYAYGGCLIQDIGYYPFGNKFFSDLSHYVRSGDFVRHLIICSSNVNEYAFALGALAHYCSDTVGHPYINRIVAISFPKLQRKYGDEVTYAEDPKSHIRVEFGFDMTQVAKNRYTSERYRDFIGFQVATPLIERAFEQTYGLKLEQVIKNVDLAVGTFRHAVSDVYPEMTRVALATRRPEIVKEIPNFNEQEFLFHLSRSEYEKEWGKDYRKPGFFAQILGFVFRWVPKIGPLKALAFKIPTPETEDLYLQSINKTTETYRGLLREIRTGDLQWPNIDLDTGREPHPGEYTLTDKTYRRLLDELASNGFSGMSSELRDNILTFYGESSSRQDTKWPRKTQRQIAMLQSIPTSSPVQTNRFTIQGKTPALKPTGHVPPPARRQ